MGDVEPLSAGVPYPVATEPARFELAEDMQTAFGPIVAAYLGVRGRLQHPSASPRPFSLLSHAGAGP